MLNIKNKYKAFHISFYPHTSLTAGLNIFFFFFCRENISFKEEEDAYTHLHMQMNMSTGYQPEVQTTIPSKSIRKEKKIKSAPTQNYRSTCAQSFHWAGSVKRWTLITVLSMEYQKHSTTEKATTLITNNRTTLDPSFAADEWLLVLTKKRAY